MPLLWLSLALLAGVLLASILILPISAWLILSGSFLILLLLGWWARTASHFPARRIIASFADQPVYLPLPPILLLLFVCLGALRGQLALPDAGPGTLGRLASLSPNVTIEGMIVEPPVRKDRSFQAVIEAERLRPSGAVNFQETKGLILATLPTGTPWQYGDRLRLNGSLELLDAEMDPSYSQYLLHQGITALMPYAQATRLASGQGSRIFTWIYQLGDRARGVIYQLYPDPEASLLTGILLGDESKIPLEVSEAFQKTGTSHIIAISGFNMSIIVALLFTFWGRILGKPRRVLAALLSIIGIAFYTILVGAGASVVRAALMGSLGLFGLQFGRRQNGILMLVFVAACMAFWNPLVLGDVGFQLSFSATLGLILFANPLEQAFRGWLARFLHGPVLDKVVGLISAYFLMTLAAQALSWPVMAYHFRQFSLASFPANVLILPVQPLAMIAGGISVILGWVYLPLGRLAALAAWPCLAYTIRVVEAFARLPVNRLGLAWFGLASALVYYALLLAWTVARNRLKSQIAVWGPAVPCAILAFLAVWTWHGALRSPDGKLHIFLLDSNTSTLSGETVLIQTSQGRYLLVGGGPNTRNLSDALGRRLPAGAGLDWWVIANPGDSYLSALPRLFELYPPMQVLWSGPQDATSTARTLQTVFMDNRTPVTQALPNQELDLGAGARLTVAAAGEQGSLLLLEWKDFRALLPLGLDPDLLVSLRDGSTIGQVNLLLLAKNGCKDLNPHGWIAALNPQLALMSSASGDRSGHPDPETLQSLDGYSVLQTRKNGWIHVTTDGKQMWVEVEKSGVE